MVGVHSSCFKVIYWFISGQGHIYGFLQNWITSVAGEVTVISYIIRPKVSETRCSYKHHADKFSPRLARGLNTTWGFLAYLIMGNPLYTFSEDFRSMWPNIRSPGQENRYIVMVKVAFSSDRYDVKFSTGFTETASGSVQFTEFRS